MKSRTLVKLRLTVLERWAVGRAPGVDEPLHLAVAVDPRRSREDGFPAYVPGSSLAGALRAHLAEEGGDAFAMRWLAPLPSSYEETTGDLKRVLSPLAIVGVVPGTMRVETRGATAINPFRGAAEANSLRLEQWVEPGDLVVILMVDGEPDERLFASLRRWQPVIGRGRSTGMGQAVVTGLEVTTRHLRTPADLTWWLGSARTTWCHAPLPPEAEVVWVPPRPASTMELLWRVAEPLHVGSGDVVDGDGKADRRDGRGAAGDRGKVRRLMRAGSQPIVPGSSWKGIFRSRAESILQIVGMDANSAGQLITVLFGDTNRGRGLLRFSDSMADADAPCVIRQHVAIDRFTGGARDGALFKVEALDEGATLTLTISADQALPNPVRNLLWHVVRDLHEGLIGVGGMTTRGYGHVRLDDASPLGDLQPVDPGQFGDLLIAATPGERAADPNGEPEPGGGEGAEE